MKAKIMDGIENNKNLDKEEKKVLYQWAEKYELTWENLKEDEHGSLLLCGAESEISDNSEAYLKRIQDEKRSSKTYTQSLVRHMLIILDGSEAMFNMELRPSRFACSVKVIGQFIKKFFQVNPISQVGLAIMYSGETKLVCPLINSSNEFIRILDKLISKNSEVTVTGKNVSLQNALEFSYEQLSYIPQSSSKEVLIVMSNMTSVDPSNVLDTIKKLKTKSITVSAIHLTAEVNLVKHVTQETNGFHKVILDETHFIACINEHLKYSSKKVISSQDLKGKEEAFLLKMGFPSSLGSRSDFSGNDVLCYCHRNSEKSKCSETNSEHSAFICPQCYTKYCYIPKKCDHCDLLLVEVPHLAKSYLVHRNTNSLKFNDIKSQDVPLVCDYCSYSDKENTNTHFDSLSLKLLKKSQKHFTYMRYCENCATKMCASCADFVSESIGFCPSCLV